MRRRPTRRKVLKLLAAGGALSFTRPVISTEEASPLEKEIPSSGERIPAIGIGSWITFNVGRDRAARDHCTRVLAGFFSRGGRVVDCSPMYGSSQETIGYALDKLDRHDIVFSAEKVWTSEETEGGQLRETRRAWGTREFDLLQIHNLLDWREHLHALRRMKEEGLVRYVGITTSHGRRHEELERIMKSEPIDFVQLTYNPADRAAERRLLPVALDRGIAVIANRPMKGGELPARLERRRLPSWAEETGARTWAQLVLKFIISHPAITCAIPATSVIGHARENVDAARGEPLSAALRRRVVEVVSEL